MNLVVRSSPPAPVTRPPRDDGAGWTRLARAHRWVAIGSATAGVLLLLNDEPALGAAALGFAVTVRAYIAVTLAWNRRHVDPPGAATPEPAAVGKTFGDFAAVLVALQGVTLALVLTLGGAAPTSTIRVAGVALVAGVLLGLLLGQAAAGGVSAGQRLLATVFLTLTVWACAFGLLCLGAALVFEG